MSDGGLTMKTLTLIAALLLGATVALAEDVVINGDTYKDVVWVTTPEQAAETQRMSIRHSAGVGTFWLEDLPKEVRERFGYDADKTAAIRAAEAAKIAEEERKAAEAAQKAADEAKAREEAARAAQEAFIDRLVQQAQQAADAAKMEEARKKAAEEAARRADRGGLFLNLGVGGVFEVTKTGDLEQLKKMVEANPECVNQRDLLGDSPLHAAVARGNKDIVAYMLSYYQTNMNVKNIQGETPLHTAAAAGDAEIAEMLINAGADVKATDRAGMTPADWADLFGHAEVAAVIRKKVAEQKK
jgi:multidrug efflux pump subunit AcrA (membrane-fusion protein)